MNIYTLISMTFVVGTSLALADDGRQVKRRNVLLICVDDLRPELACFGVDYISSPNIDALARRGCRFDHHYVQAPTCGASRFALLTGTYGPADNYALFHRAKRLADARVDQAAIAPTLPEWFLRQGYATVAVGKVSHHPGGLGGPDWDDPQQIELPGAWEQQPVPAGLWQHPRGIMHGLAHGAIRENAEEMDLFESEVGDDSIYPDGVVIAQALEELERAARHSSEQPFFMAVGIIRPHLPFGAPANYMRPYRDIHLPPIPHPTKPEGRTTWHRSGEFMKYNRWGRDPNLDPEFAELVRKHYAACVSYADALVGKLLDRLNELGLQDDTVIVLWGDHGWHLGEHAIWGKHSLFEESLRSPLIISHSSLSQPGSLASGVVETIDIFPTLCELTGLPIPDTCQGTSLVAMLEDASVAVKQQALSYQGNRASLRTATHRMILHEDGHVELYDHTTSAAETENIATRETALVEALTRRLRQRLPR
jgi:iduronate 2-sulfatase